MVKSLDTVVHISKTKQKTLKTTKGVTLIALIITILVLLILAGIAFNAVLGENGLLKRTAGAGEVERRKNYEERLLFIITDEVTESYEQKTILDRDKIKTRIEQEKSERKRKLDRLCRRWRRWKNRSNIKRKRYVLYKRRRRELENRICGRNK